MVGKLILRGLVVGVVAGLLAFGWARVFGEPAVDAAIGFESSKAAAAGEAQEPEIFSREVQSGIGLLTGLVAVGAGMGALFGVLFAFANGRFGTLGPQPTAALLALLALVSVYIVPALKFPPSPPAVGDPETIKYRTALYFLTLAMSIAATIFTLILRSRLVPRHGGWNASLIAGVVYVVVIGLFYSILPEINEIPEGFPAGTLWDFRIASLGIQVVLWAAIGLLFGFLVDRPQKPA